jgi:hypothetical protein
MFDAMILKRKILADCSIDVKILDTSEDGIVLRFENTGNRSSITRITDFVKEHKLNILFDDGVCFISNQILSPSEPTYMSE